MSKISNTFNKIWNYRLPKKNLSPGKLRALSPWPKPPPAPSNQAANINLGSGISTSVGTNLGTSIGTNLGIFSAGSNTYSVWFPSTTSTTTTAVSGIITSGPNVTITSTAWSSGGWQYQNSFGISGVSGYPSPVGSYGVSGSFKTDLPPEEIEAAGHDYFLLGVWAQWVKKPAMPCDFIKWLKKNADILHGINDRYFDACFTEYLKNQSHYDSLARQPTSLQWISRQGVKNAPSGTGNILPAQTFSGSMHVPVELYRKVIAIVQEDINNTWENTQECKDLIRAIEVIKEGSKEAGLNIDI